MLNHSSSSLACIRCNYIYAGMTELAPSSPATSHQIWLGSLVSLNNDSDEVAIRVFFLDGSFKVLTINEYTTADDLHRCLVAKLRNVSSVGVDMNDPLMQEFGLFIVSETGSSAFFFHLFLHCGYVSYIKIPPRF